MVGGWDERQVTGEQPSRHRRLYSTLTKAELRDMVLKLTRQHQEIQERFMVTRELLIVAEAARAEGEQARTELSNIDTLLARRTALDDYSSRYDKIVHTLRMVTWLNSALRRHGKHPASCPKGVGIGAYQPPDDAVCNCGIDQALGIK